MWDRGRRRARDGDGQDRSVTLAPDQTRQIEIPLANWRAFVPVRDRRRRQLPAVRSRSGIHRSAVARLPGPHRAAMKKASLHVTTLLVAVAGRGRLARSGSGRAERHLLRQRELVRTAGRLHRRSAAVQRSPARRLARRAAAAIQRDLGRFVSRDARRPVRARDDVRRWVVGGTWMGRWSSTTAGRRMWPRGATGMVDADARRARDLRPVRAATRGRFISSCSGRGRGSRWSGCPRWALTPRRVGFWAFALSAGLKRTSAAVAMAVGRLDRGWALLALAWSWILKGRAWLEREQVWPALRWILAGSLVLNRRRHLVGAAGRQLGAR